MSYEYMQGMGQSLEDRLTPVRSTLQSGDQLSRIGFLRRLGEELTQTIREVHLAETGQPLTRSALFSAQISFRQQQPQQAIPAAPPAVVPAPPVVADPNVEAPPVIIPPDELEPAEQPPVVPVVTNGNGVPVIPPSGNGLPPANGNGIPEEPPVFDELEPEEFVPTTNGAAITNGNGVVTAAAEEKTYFGFTTTQLAIGAVALGAAYMLFIRK